MDNHQNNNETFHYTYSAKEQEELKSIRRKYLPREEDKMETLRRLDRSAAKKAQSVSMAVGIVGALILGFGMSLAMTDLREILGSHRDLAMLIGIPIGVVGIALVCCAYPIYTHLLKKERKKIAPEIMRLTDELLK